MTAMVPARERGRLASRKARNALMWASASIATAAAVLPLVLVLYYVAQFEAMLIRIVAEFFSQANRSADFSGSVALAEKLEEATKDFWFIFNEPSALDEQESELQKTNLRILGLPVPEGTIYYIDPIERIKAVVGKENLRRLHW